MEKLTRDEIKSRLERIAEEEPPHCYGPMAMCYSPASPPEEVVYTCPVCLHRTVHNDPDKAWDINATLEWKLEHIRDSITKIRGIEVTLDEREFCRRCSPGIETPSLRLLIKAGENQPRHTVGKIGVEDIDLLIEFCNDERTHKGERDSCSPLKDHLKRLYQLLGVVDGI